MNRTGKRLRVARKSLPVFMGIVALGCATPEDEDSAEVPLFGEDEVGGDRPARVVVPESYDGLTPMPLLFLLHGYTANADIQDLYFRLSARADEDGFILVLPNGTIDSEGNTFWNSWALSAETVDDVGYLIGLLDEMEATWRVDSSKVYFLGHSNGGYMSYRMACEHADRITGILNFAGLSPYWQESNCQPSEPVSMLHAHGTNDDRVPYDAVEGRPGAEEVTALWLERNGCDVEAETEGESLDLVKSLEGTETTVRDWTEGCSDDTAVSLWTMNEVGHSPFFNENWSQAIVEWLLKRSK